MSYYIQQKQYRSAQQRRSVARKEAIRNLVAALVIFGAWILIETIIYHIQFGW